MTDFSRTELVLGDSIQKLFCSHIAVFGIGGVGSYVAEALARCGVGKLTLVDSDNVSASNINRQIIALNSTVGKPKTSVMKDRIADINPDAQVFCHNMFFTAENADSMDFSQFDYVVDAIDTVSSKLLIAQICDKLNIPLISSMGTGNKLHPEMFKIADISKTSVCPLARVMRRELKLRGIKKLKVLYSEEIPIKPQYNENSEKKGSGMAPGSISFVPSVAGLMIAGEVIRDICGKN